MGNYLDIIRQVEEAHKQADRNPTSQPEPLSDVHPRVSAWSVRDREVSAQITPPRPANEPTPPLAAGWLVAYRDQSGALRGGCDDRQHGTVEASRWDGKAWTVTLTDGQEMPLSRIRSVGEMNSTGQIVAAWTVREHGYDGRG